MSISLNPETQELIERQMRQTGFDNADDLIRLALRTLEQTRAEDYEELDDETRASIERSEEDYARGGGIPAAEAFAMLRKKHFGDNGA